MAPQSRSHFNIRFHLCRVPKRRLSEGEILVDYILPHSAVEKKYRDKMNIKFEDSPKIGITTNYAINGTGGSFNGRKKEFELSATFNDSYSREMRYGRLLFEEWDQEQWNHFYNEVLKHYHQTEQNATTLLSC